MSGTSKDRPLDQKNRLIAQTERAVADRPQEYIDSTHDAGDASVADATASEAFTAAEHDSAILTQVIDALKRVDDGMEGAWWTANRSTKKRLECLWTWCGGARTVKSS
jgi:hypothetical protein